MNATPTSHRALVRQTYSHAVGVQQQGPEIACGRGFCQTSGMGMGLGCGDPTALADLQAGEVVLDLGCGQGFDCLVAAHFVGRSGRVIGIDMTAEMLSQAHDHAIAAGVSTVTFLNAEIERLPLADATFDVVMSNCVINLCPDKAGVLSEAYRVLRPGGRLALSDIVALQPLPDAIVDDLTMHVGCVAGAAAADELTAALQAIGFESVCIDIRAESPSLIGTWAPGKGLERFVAAADIVARKS